MKTRKWTALVAAVALVTSVASTALAASVGADVYGDKQAKGVNMPQTQVSASLGQAGVKDISADQAYAGSVVVVLQAGLLTADASGNFRPEANAATDDTVAAFAKVLGIATAADSVTEAVQKAVAAGYLTDDVAGRQSINRITVAKLIAAAKGIKPDYSLEVPFKDSHLLNRDEEALLTALYHAGIFKGYDDGTFGPYDTLTRLQLAILLDRVMGGN